MNPEKLKANEPILPKITDFRFSSLQKQPIQEDHNSCDLRQKQNSQTKEKQKFYGDFEYKISNFLDFKNENSNISKANYNLKNIKTKTNNTNKPEAANRSSESPKKNSIHTYNNYSDKNNNADNNELISYIEANKENNLNLVNHPNVIYKGKKNDNIEIEKQNSNSKNNSTSKKKSKYIKENSFRKSNEDIIGDFISLNNKIESNFNMHRIQRTNTFESIDELSTRRNSKPKIFNNLKFENNKSKNDFIKKDDYEFIKIRKTTIKPNKIKMNNSNNINFKTPNELDLEANENFANDHLKIVKPSPEDVKRKIKLKKNFYSKNNFDKINIKSINDNEKVKYEDFVYNKPFKKKNLSLSNDCFKSAANLPNDSLMEKFSYSNEIKKSNFSSSVNLDNSKKIISKINSQKACNTKIKSDNYYDNDDNLCSRIKNKNSNNDKLNAISKTEKKVEDNKNNINKRKENDIEVKNNTNNTAKEKMMSSNNNEDNNLASKKKVLKAEKSTDRCKIKTINDLNILNSEYELINNKNAQILKKYGTLDQSEVENVLFDNLNKRSSIAFGQKKPKSNSEKYLIKSNEINSSCNAEANKVNKSNTNNKHLFSQSNKGLWQKTHENSLLSIEKTNLDFLTNVLIEQQQQNKRLSIANSAAAYKNHNLLNSNNSNINMNIKNFDSQNVILSIKAEKEENIENKESKENQQQQENTIITCRICLENNENNNVIQTTAAEAEEHFISPCVCHGTMKYVHESCLKKWIPSQVKKISKAECEICKTEYKIKFKSKLVYNSEKMCQFLERFFTFIGIVSLLLFVLSFVIYSIVVNVVKFSANEKDVFTLVLSLSCVVVILIVVAVILRNYKSNVYEVIPTHWTILEFDSKDKDYEQHVRYEMFRKLSEEMDARERESMLANYANASFNINNNLQVVNNNNIFHAADVNDNNSNDLAINRNILLNNSIHRNDNSMNPNNASNVNNINNINNVQIINFPSERNLIENTNQQQNDVINEETDFNLNKNSNGREAFNNLGNKEYQIKEIIGTSRYINVENFSEETQVDENNHRNSTHYDINNI